MYEKKITIMKFYFVTLFQLYIASSYYILTEIFEVKHAALIIWMGQND